MLFPKEKGRTKKTMQFKEELYGKKTSERNNVFMYAKSNSLIRIMKQLNKYVSNSA